MSIFINKPKNTKPLTFVQKSKSTFLEVVRGKEELLHREKNRTKMITIEETAPRKPIIKRRISKKKTEIEVLFEKRKEEASQILEKVPKNPILEALKSADNKKRKTVEETQKPNTKEQFPENEKCRNKVKKILEERKKMLAAQAEKRDGFGISNPKNIPLSETFKKEQEKKLSQNQNSFVFIPPVFVSALHEASFQQKT